MKRTREQQSIRTSATYERQGARRSGSERIRAASAAKHQRLFARPPLFFLAATLLRPRELDLSTSLILLAPLEFFASALPTRFGASVSVPIARL